MDPLVIGLGVAVGLASIAIRAVLRGGRGPVHEVLLRSAAERRGGEVRQVGLGEVWELALPLERHGIAKLGLRYVRLPGASSPERMLLTLSLQRVLPQLGLRPQGVLAELGTAMGGQDIQSGDPDLDRCFVIASPEAEVVQELFRPPVVRSVFGLTRSRPGTLVWLALAPDTLAGSSQLEVMVSGWVSEHKDLRALLDAGEELGRALVRAWDAPWLETAHARGLAVGKLGQRGASSLVGVLGGVPVEARARRGPSGWRTEVTAWVDGLAGLRVVHRDTARAEGWDEDRVELGNPVLDMLVAARADDPAALRTLLACDRLAEELLPVVHGRPGSVLQHDSVRLVERGRLTRTLGAAIDDALALAKAVLDLGR